MTKHVVNEYFLDFVLPYQGDDCLLWPYTRNGAGYGQMVHDKRRKLVTRVICERIYGPAPSSKHQAAHSCGNGSQGCCNPRHLRWATRQENEADKLGHGTSNRGERHWSAKLAPADVLEIRALKDVLPGRK